MDSLREEVFRYVREKYGCEIERPRMLRPDYAVFRHPDNRKSYGTVMETGPRPGDGRADVLSVKVADPLLLDLLKRQEGFLPARSSGRGGWLSVLLDGTVPMRQIEDLIDGSYAATASAKTMLEIRPPKDWVIPSNPKYYDIVTAFARETEIRWKQGKGIRKGDIVYLYVGQPYSAILYRCVVTCTNIPYSFEREGLKISRLMKIRLLKRYPAGAFTFERLNAEYRIFAVRGPRGIPAKLSEDLKKYGTGREKK